ncbi:MAG TPA: hypothetical protein VLM75_11160 [Spirochaetota bacterium]|nr:hypothetical protein [Spirochaetota bacterium]
MSDDLLEGRGTALAWRDFSLPVNDGCGIRQSLSIREALSLAIRKLNPKLRGERI